MTDQVNNVQAFALGGSNKIDRNRVDSSLRKDIQKKGLEFKQDKNLNDTEMKLLKKEFGMDKAQVEEWSKMDNGVEFLEAMLHAGGTSTDKKVIKAEREKIAKEFLLNNRTIHLGNNEKFLAEQLKEFGVDSKEIGIQVETNYIDKEAPLKTIVPDPASGNTAATKVRMHYPTDINGEVTKDRIDLYAGDSDYNLLFNPVDSNPDFKGSLLLDKKSGYYVLYGENRDTDNRYFKLNGDQGLREVSQNAVKLEKMAQEKLDANLKAADQKETAKMEADFQAKMQANAEKALAEIEQKSKKAAAARTKDTIAKTKTVTVDSGNSKQRLVSQKNWQTGFVVPRNAKYAENGLPTKVSIRLPKEYGTKGPDGKVHVGYQDWKLIDAEKGVYTDKAGLRKFQIQIQDGKVSFNQIDINDKKIKKFLDDNTKIAAEKAKANGLNEQQNKMEIKDAKAAKDIMSDLADRNKAWETYLQTGSDNGYVTGSQGLIEKLVDESATTGIKTYKDLKPALDGLMARVPQTPEVLNSAEYKAVTKILNEMKAAPNKELTTGWFRGTIKGNPARELDEALTNLAKTHLAGKVQGTNHANNSYLVGGNGKVIIQPDKSSSGFMSDAKITIDGKDYYLYQERFLMDRTVDFQDSVQHKDDGTRDELSVIKNEVTGNNRHGEITFDVEKAKAEQFYFQTSGGEELAVKVENDVAYVIGSDGSKVPVNDVLNGRAPMPS